MIGRRLWQGWIISALNSVLVCFIGFKTSQFGFIPANLFCIGIYAWNVRLWRASHRPERTLRMRGRAHHFESAQNVIAHHLRLRKTS
jgi:hypothetical protein